MPDLRGGRPTLKSPRSLPAASGLLLALSFPPLHLVVPPFVALAPLAVYLHGLRGNEEAGARAWRAGLVAGGVAWGLLLHWMLAMAPYSLWAVPGYVAVVAGLAAVTGAVAWCCHRLVTGVRMPLWLALALAWTAGEWLRNHLPGPLAFPWLGLGTSLTSHPQWVGAAEVVGERGVSFWLALVAGIVATAWTTGRGRGRRLLAAGVLAVAVPVLGSMRAERLVVRPVLRVAVLQPNVAQDVRLTPGASDAATIEALDRLERLAASEAPDLVVLPEALFLEPLEGERGARLEDRLRTLAARVGAPVLVGGLGVGGDVGGDGGGDDAMTYNSVFLVDSAGLGGYRYDKHRLVPMVERLPLPRLPWMARAAAGHGFGEGWPLARVGAVDVGAFVCFEAAFQDVTRGLRRSGADILVNVTNDAWLGWTRPPLRSVGLWQHPAHLVMRAVETRTGIVRAANTGLSFVVDPVGRVTGRLPLFQEGVLAGTVLSAGGQTLFVRWGDVAGLGSFLATLILIAAPPIARRTWRGARPASHPGPADPTGMG
ncbi:MAG TPA: apolipoprotein N-acyltransferase [Longimicrobiales bacterium]